MAMGVHTASRRGGRSRRRAPMAEINVTPLVDVMLVLLIIFMVTAPLLASGVPIDLPDSRANALDQQPDQVTVSLDSTGAIYIDDAAVPSGGLPDALAQLRQGADGSYPLVTLRADRRIDYGRVMAVMGEMNRAGITSISLVTNGSVEAP
ncbi:MAG: biopolymer transporter ExbD [Sphingomonadales bacterium]|nr:biopolymer transporter ExbD [Sphingomonadales bacterium]MBD3773473.1 biopolymer transporter ExbD [Paracoccaceae bacterium]